MCARPSGGAGAGARVTGTATSSKQGAVLHYAQRGRVFTAREVARMHGFGGGIRLGVDEAIAVARTRARQSAGAAAAAAVAAASGGGGADVDAEGLADEDAGATGDATSGAGVAGRDGGVAGREDSASRAITMAYYAIGNAVPPPLGVALAREIARASR
jgi:site-specific DNA-cytosine methylase